MKSSRSIQSSRVKGTRRLPADGSSGLLGDLHLLDLPLGVVLDDDLEGVEDGEAAQAPCG